VGDKRKWLIWIISIILICVIFNIANTLWRSRFGYFVEGPELKYEHRGADVLKLEDGNVLIIGEHKYVCPTKTLEKSSRETINCIKKQVMEIPFEIYDAKNNVVKTQNGVRGFIYKPNGILMKNNRLLLIHAHKIEQGNYKKMSNPYDLMLIVDLKTMKVENVIKKRNYSTDTSFSLIGDNRLLIIDSLNKIWDIYNLNTGKLKFLENIDIECQTIIATENERALIFNHTGDVYEYNNKDSEVKIVGNVFKRGFAIVKKLNNGELLIMGGVIDNVKNKRLPIEIYNIRTNQSRTIINMPDDRAYSISRGNTFSGELLNNRYFLIAGGDANNYPFDTPLKNLLILDLLNNKIHIGPKLPYNITAPAMFQVSNNAVFISGNKSDYNCKKNLLFIWKEN